MWEYNMGKNAFAWPSTILVLLLLPTGVAAAAWTTKSPFPSPPRSALFAETVGDFIYSGEGIGASSSGFGRFDRYDPSTDTWVTRQSGPAIYARGSAVSDGKIYAFGGVGTGAPLSNVDVYDPVTDSWSGLASMPTPRSSNQAVEVNGEIYVLGGSPSFGANPGTTANEAYDPVTNVWQSKAPMPVPRIGHAAAAVGGKIYVFGGATKSSSGATIIIDQVDVYDPSTDSWSTLPDPMPNPRGGTPGIAVLNDKILIIGGSSLTLGTVALVDEFDPNAEIWAAREPLPFGRVALAATVSGGLVYAIGGENNDPGFPGYLDTVQAYDAEQDPTRERVVAINIKPGSDPNSINTCSGGTTPVTIWGSNIFDVATVDPNQLVLASATVKTVGKSDRTMCSIGDEGAPDGAFFDSLDPTPDGYLDLTCHFVTFELTELDDNSTTADLSITGCDLGESCQTGDSGYYQATGTDSVNIVKDC